MNRCRTALSFSRPRLGALVLTALCAAGPLAIAPAAAQGTVQGSMSGMRNFPDAALRGSLVITGASDAEINGRTIRMAPGMRLFSPQNTLVMMHTIKGQQFTVNYLIENSTGMLHLCLDSEQQRGRTAAQGQRHSAAQLPLRDRRHPRALIPRTPGCGRAPDSRPAAGAAHAAHAPVF